MAFRAGHQWEAFWRNLKEGYDMFDNTRLPPVVGVKDQAIRVLCRRASGT